MADMLFHPDKKDKPCLVSSLACRCLLGISFALTSCFAFSDCPSGLPLSGVVTIKTCDAGKEVCVAGEKAVYDYMQNADDSKPEVYTVALNSSPWRFYDAEMRIIAIEEMANLLKPSITKDIKSIELIASWTGVAPDRKNKSLAQKLSAQLNGFSVRGMDGFLWIAKNRKLRTTHQAFSGHAGLGPYKVADGDEVFISYVAGWNAEIENQYIKDQNADGIMRAGTGWDIYFLCPDRALQSFELAAKLGHPIAAYNAALMRIERGKKNDMKIAKTLLIQAANNGDNKAKIRLQTLQRGIK